jgi:hypothetical protein
MIAAYLLWPLLAGPDGEPFRPAIETASHRRPGGR